MGFGLNYPHMELPPEKDTPESDANPAAKPDQGKGKEFPKTLGGLPFTEAGPEFYKKYGGKTFFLRPVSSIRTKAPEKTPAKQPEIAPENPSPTHKKD